MITAEEEAQIRQLAKDAGLDEDAVVAAAKVADETPQGGGKPGQAVGAAEKPKLFMYLLAFVTVDEVRENWLGLPPGPFPGNGQVAAAWAQKFAQQSGPAAGNDATAEDVPTE